MLPTEAILSMPPGFATLSRRRFLQRSAVVSAATVTGSIGGAGEIQHTAPPRKLLKTLKIEMIGLAGDLTAKFQVAKDAGFDGVELSAPGIDVPATRAAIDATGLAVDGSVCSTHWQFRHTSADAVVRKRALQDLKTAIEQTHAVGGHTVLLVAGHGADGSPQEVWSRAINNIRQALPLCAKLGITIAIENVWNHFLYQHDGPDDQTADSFVRFVDEFSSPWLGMQFDIGNHWKYGNPAAWIRQLRHRIVKLDIKGFNRQQDRWQEIGDEDLPWADVRQALDEIGYHGWVAAEVGGGDLRRLQQVAKQIDRALHIG